ncbi:MAG: sigma-54-dependent Fis family transcriptional regulator [Verrucomicrobia bacterium]|nr:sigma-54-dependent Fis family transcriptional regulator [Verrucomicrobiota bacterium]
MRALIIDDEKAIRNSTVVAIRAEGHIADSADSKTVALLKLQEDAYDLVFLDLRLGSEDGLEVLEEIKRAFPQVQVVVFTAYASVASAVTAIQKGAFDYLEKPFTPENLRQILSRVEKQRKLESKIVELQREIDRQNPSLDFSSEDAPMKAALDILFKAAPTQAAILLLGEGGTGKSVLAKAIHDRSEARDAPFVTVSCPSLSRELLESELFGHVKGAFTGAIRDTWGKVAAAESGTLFLDEIGELPLEIQPKLLRLLQERQYERVGEHKIRVTNARIIAATNNDLKERVRAGSFREDLYYRLDVISVRIPPLRERAHDLERLAKSYLEFFGRQLARPRVRLSDSALKKLRVYLWPGNLRELRNTIERAVILAPDDVIGEEFLPENPPAAPDANIAVGSEISLEMLEEAHIRIILGRASSLDAAAKTLGIDPATLYRKRKRLNLQ